MLAMLDDRVSGPTERSTCRHKWNVRVVDFIAAPSQNLVGYVTLLLDGGLIIHKAKIIRAGRDLRVTFARRRAFKAGLPEYRPDGQPRVILTISFDTTAEWCDFSTDVIAAIRESLPGQLDRAAAEQSLRNAISKDN